MSNQSELDKLLQREWRENVIPASLRKRPNDPCIPVYQDLDDGTVDLAINSVLIPNENVEQLLQTPDWGRLVDMLQPGFTGGSDDSDPVYHRFVGSEYDIEPLVIQRKFHGLKPDTIEILEEFRLYHNLYGDHQDSKLVRFDAGGNEFDVVKFDEDFVQVSRKELRQFLAARDSSLLVFYDRRYHVGKRLEVENDARSKFVKTDSYVYRFDVFDSRNLVDGKPVTYSRLLGKNVIGGLPREKCGIWPYDAEPIGELEKFIIGTDENEDAILAYSSPYNDSAATTDLELPTDYVVYDYLTPVFFDRRVLNKYRDEPSKYQVYDGYLQCREKWGLQIDNNSPDHVIVWLGDLGHELPYTEHAHWKGYNVTPDGQMSASHVHSQLPSTLEEALNPGVPENSSLRFKQAYRNLDTAWKNRFGWSLFRPLDSTDEYHWSKLRVPSTPEYSEFFDITLSLTIVTIDSINVANLKQEIPKFNVRDDKGKTKLGITVLEEFLAHRHFADADKYVRSLRTLQNLRSMGAVHRKGKKYARLARDLQLGTRKPKTVADELFATLADFLDSLRNHFCQDDPD